jgi:hypothetical protein
MLPGMRPRASLAAPGEKEGPKPGVGARESCSSGAFQAKEFVQVTDGVSKVGSKSGRLSLPNQTRQRDKTFWKRAF